MATRMLIGEIDGGRLVRVVGRGTMQESPAFQEAVKPHLDHELVVFDASECEYLDSTFLGCLVGAQKVAKTSPTGRFAIVAGEADRARLFSLSALHKYFEFLETCPEPVCELESAEAAPLEKKTLGRHVADCHADLAERGGPEAPTFQAIAQRMSEELDRA